LRLENAELNRELNEVLYNKASIGLPLFDALSVVLQDRRAFFEPGTTSYRLKDGLFSKEVEIDPRDLVCVFTVGKGRGKAFIIRQDFTTPDGITKEGFKRYEANNNDITFEDIKLKFDPTGFRLVQISQNKLVNVAYYEFEAKDLLALQNNVPNDKEFKQFKITKVGANELFKAFRRNWNENYSLQKRITNYMNGETGSGRP
jgi:hypothetical protein